MNLSNEALSKQCHQNYMNRKLFFTPFMLCSVFADVFMYVDDILPHNTMAHSSGVTFGICAYCLYHHCTSICCCLVTNLCTAFVLCVRLQNK